MNIVTNNEIQARLNADWIYLNKIYNHKNILGVFVVQKANFGLAKTSSDITTVAVIFPTITDLAIGSSQAKRGSLMTKEGTIYIVNFCDLFDELFNPDSFVEEIFFTSYFLVNKMYKKLFSQIQVNTEAASDSARNTACITFKVDMPHHADKLTAQLTQLFELYLQFQDGVQDKFFDSLTKTEEKALIFILECIGEEGIISVSEAIKASGISRPVFTSLFDKLARYKSAEIRNMGVKGTYINFYDHILSKFEIS